MSSFGQWSLSFLVWLTSLTSCLTLLLNLWRSQRLMLTTKRECNKSNNLIKSSTLVLSLLISYKIISRTLIQKVRSNTTKRCPTSSKFFQAPWRPSLRSFCTKMQSESTDSCKTEMTTFTLSILRSSKRRDIAKEKPSLRLVISLSLCASSWMEWFTTQQLKGTLREVRWLIMTL